MQALWAIIVAVVLAGRRIAAAPVEWKVVSVHDGDTLTAVDAANVQHKVRLHGIDAPEVKQAFGTKARDRLAELTAAEGRPGQRSRTRPLRPAACRH
jgi:endonuclease YncB( thermonuclease family)